MPKEKTIAERLRAARAKSGYSQAQAAEAWKVSKRTLQGWETSHEPRGLYLEKVEQILKEAGE